MSTLTVNGREHGFEAGTFPASVLDLITHLALPAEALVAELDGEVVRPRDFATTPLTPGSRIELVQFVGGG